MNLVDSHAHLDFPDFEGELDALVERADAAGVERIISIGTDLESSAGAIRLAERFDKVWAVVGWHPCTALDAPEDIREPLAALAAHPKVVAIGETGLDHHHLPSEREGCDEGDDQRYRSAQERLFQQQLEVASGAGLNVVVHQRDAFEPTVGMWEPYAARGIEAVFHCFVGTISEMERIVALGGLVSFTGIVTFKNAASVRETLVKTPEDRFMLETDCPYLAPVPFRGKRCEPAHVREIAEQVATVRGVSLDAVAEKTGQTVSRFFKGIS